MARAEGGRCESDGGADGGGAPRLMFSLRARPAFLLCCTFSLPTIKCDTQTRLETTALTPKTQREAQSPRARRDNRRHSRHRPFVSLSSARARHTHTMATQAALDAAGKLEDLPAREQALRAVVFAGGENEADAETVKVKEAAVGMLADALTRQAKAQALAQLLQDLRAFFAVIPKAKTAKLVRTVIDQIAKVPDSTELQVR